MIIHGTRRVPVFPLHETQKWFIAAAVAEKGFGAWAVGTCFFCNRFLGDFPTFPPLFGAAILGKVSIRLDVVLRPPAVAELQRDAAPVLKPSEEAIVADRFSMRTCARARNELNKNKGRLLSMPPALLE
jgi:hypothetical protein